MFKKNSNEMVLLLLQRTQISLFRSSNNAITNLKFPPAVVEDLEVKDELAFTKLLKSFISAQQFTTAEIVIILDKSVYFSKAIEEKTEDTDTKKAEAQQKKKVAPAVIADPSDNSTASHEELSEAENMRMLFVQSMPFTNIYSRIMTIGKSKTIIAINRELYEPIVKAFNEAKLEVTHIYPILVVADVFAEKGFNPETAQHLLENRVKYKEQNFLIATEKKVENLSTVIPKDKKDRKRVLALVIFFIVLLATLAGVWWWSQKNSPQDTIERRGPAVPATGASVIATPEPTPTPTPEPVVSLTELLSSTQSAELSIELIDASGGSTAADTLETQLTEVGFKNVLATENAPQQAGAMIVSVQSGVALSLREALLAQFNTWGYQTNFQESETQEASIVITVTKQ